MARVIDGISFGVEIVNLQVCEEAIQLDSVIPCPHHLTMTGVAFLFCGPRVLPTPNLALRTPSHWQSHHRYEPDR